MENLPLRIFVTGATGFIGAHFVELAAAAGHQVTGLYRVERSDNKSLLHHLKNQGVELTKGDVLYPESLAAALTGCDVVCHFAAAFNQSGSADNHFHRVNVEGTVGLLTAAAQHGVKRFIFCSTAGIYGRQVDGVIDERTPAKPWNEYESSKFAAEREIRERASALGIEYVILRPSVVYGPRDGRLSKLFKSVLKGRFPLFGRGEGRRHMVYVSDVAEAFLCACEEPGAANHEMIIAGPEAVKLRDMLQLLAQLSSRKTFGPKLPLKPMLGLAAVIEDICKPLGINPPLYRRRMDFYLNDAAFNCSRAREVLGWEPKIALDEGLHRTLQAHQVGNAIQALQYPLLINLSVAATDIATGVGPSVS